MLSGVWFVLKTLSFAILVLIVLQMKLGDKTLEEQTTLWVQESRLIAPVEKFAVQTGRFVKEEWKQFDFSKTLNKAKNGIKQIYPEQDRKDSPEEGEEKPSSAKKFQWG